MWNHSILWRGHSCIDIVQLGAMTREHQLEINGGGHENEDSCNTCSRSYNIACHWFHSFNSWLDLAVSFSVTYTFMEVLWNLVWESLLKLSLLAHKYLTIWLLDVMNGKYLYWVGNVHVVHLLRILVWALGGHACNCCGHIVQWSCFQTPNDWKSLPHLVLDSVSNCKEFRVQWRSSTVGEEYGRTFLRRWNLFL